MLLGRCLPDLKPTPDPWMPFAPSVSQFSIEWDVNSAPGYHFDVGRTPELALADGGMPWGWWPRTPPKVNGELRLPSDDTIRALAEDLDARMRLPDGTLQCFGLRFVELNLGTYGTEDPDEIRALAQHWIDLVREVLPPDRCVFSMCLYPDASMSMKSIPKFIPAGCLAVGADVYTAQSVDPTTAVGKRAAWIAAAAHAMGRVFVTLESGVTPCVDVNGQPIAAAVDHAKALVQFWKDTDCGIACVTSLDWTKVAGMQAWGDGVLTKNPSALAALTDGLAHLGAVKGPMLKGGLSATVSALSAAGSVGGLAA